MDRYYVIFVCWQLLHLYKKDILLGAKSNLRIIGCGTGYLTFPMAMRNAEVSIVGLDIVSDTINRTKELLF